jgi:hypothetical protein
MPSPGRNPVSIRPHPKERLLYGQALHDYVQETICSAHEQVERARQLVEHSQEIVARIKLSLARSQQIQHGTAGSLPENPLIPGKTK